MLGKEHKVEHFYSLVKRLATADWFTSRVSSAPLFPVVYSALDNEQRAESRQYVILTVDSFVWCIRINIFSVHLKKIDCMLALLLMMHLWLDAPLLSILGYVLVFLSQF